MTNSCGGSIWSVRFARTRSGATRTIERSAGANPATTPMLARTITPFWHAPAGRRDRARSAGTADRPAPLPRELLDTEALDDLKHLPEAEQLRAAVASGDLREVEGNVARYRRLLALLKVGATVAWIEGALEEGEAKVLAWAWHVEALQQLHQGLARHNLVLVTGGTPRKLRDVNVAAFQDDPEVRVFIGQIQAAGQAVTLTAGRRAVFLEQAFVPAMNWQALKRCHRIGQHRPVLGEVLVVPGSIDEAVQALLVRKAHDIASLEAAA